MNCAFYCLLWPTGFHVGLSFLWLFTVTDTAASKIIYGVPNSVTFLRLELWFPHLGGGGKPKCGPSPDHKVDASAV